MSAVPIPLVDLHAQYLSIKGEIDDAIGAVIAESAFIGTPSNRFVREFEEAFAPAAGQPHCVACANGTDAIEIVLEAAGIGAGDEVLVPALTWIATSEAVTRVGATPVFVDVLPDRYTIDPDAAAALVTARTRAVIPVHLYGAPAEMASIMALAARHRLFVLEDCAQAHLARYANRPVGTFGHAATYSFFPSKNLGAWGDAGAIVTGDDALARAARMIGQHGQGARKHDHQREGRNSRMDGLQAAILSVKLRHLAAWTRARQARAAAYRRDLAGVVAAIQTVPDGAEHVYHLMTVELDDRDAVASFLAADGIATAVQYPRPLPLVTAYAARGARAEDYPVAERVTRRILSLPLYAELADEQYRRIVDAVRRAVTSCA